jgi:hypothetical protein
MKAKDRVFRNVDEVISTYFARFLPRPQPDQELEPRLAGEHLAEQIANGMKVKVQEALAEPTPK